MKSRDEHSEPDIEKIRLVDIRTDKAQTRAQIDQETVCDYAALMGDGAVFPPPAVFRDEKEEAYWLADGFHRYSAAEQLGWESIDCEVHRGSVSDALKYSIEANSTHGLRRTNADKRRAVEIALDHSKEWRLSDRAIAKLCGVSNNFVGTVRKGDQKPGVSSDDTSKKKPGKIAVEQLPEPSPAAKARRSKSRDRLLANGSKPVATVQNRKHALALLNELDQVFATLGLQDKYSAYLEEMTAGVESLRRAA